MAIRQSFIVPNFRGQSVDELRREMQFHFQQIMNRLDELAGTRGTPKFFADVDANKQRVTNIGAPKSDTDAQRVDHCLHADTPGGAYDARGRRIVGLNQAVLANEAVILEQIQNLLGPVEALEFIRRDGSVELTADWDAGGFEIRAQTFESDIATGTAPMVVASTTVVTNLNASKPESIVSRIII